MNVGIQKDFEGIVIQKNALTGQSNELHLSSFGYHHPGLVSLAAVFWASRNAPPKEKIGGALRDIQKTAARETTLRLDYIGIPYRGLISEL